MRKDPQDVTCGPIGGGQRLYKWVGPKRKVHGDLVDWEIKVVIV